jgi:hypothetical protein
MGVDDGHYQETRVELPREERGRRQQDLVGSARPCRRWKALDEEIKTLDRQIQALVLLAAPELVSLFGIDVELAGQFLMTVETTPSASATRPPSPSFAASHLNTPAAAEPPAATG